MPIVEANAVGRVVISSNTTSMPEIAADAAVLVDPFDVSSIRAGFIKAGLSGPNPETPFQGAEEKVLRAGGRTQAATGATMTMHPCHHYGRARHLHLYLDILEQAWTAWGQPRPVGGVVHDVGASNFWYARALHAFFLPAALTGVEVEGHRIYYNGYSRHDYAQGYVRNLPQTSFVIADYAQYALRVPMLVPTIRRVDN